MIQMWIDVTFLGLILIPVFILFAAFYQDLLEIPRLEQKIKRGKIKVRSSYTGQGEILPVKLRVVK